jgi:hypothetical protein
LEELVELVESSAIFFSRVMTCCEQQLYPGIHLKENLDDCFSASFEDELGFPDLHATSQNTNRNTMERFSQCWTFLLAEIEDDVPSKIQERENGR